MALSPAENIYMKSLAEAGVSRAEAEEALIDFRMDQAPKPGFGVAEQTEFTEEAQTRERTGVFQEGGIFGGGAIGKDVQRAEETGKPIGGLTGVGIGAAKGVASTATGAVELGLKGLEALPGKGLLDKEGKIEEAIGETAEDIGEFREEKFTPEGGAQKVGFLGEQIAEFFIPAGLVLKGSKAIQASGKLKRMPKILRTMITAAATEAPAAGAITLAQTGGDVKQAGATAALATFIPGAGAVAGKFIKPQRLMNKALGLTKSQNTKLSLAAKKAGFENIDEFAIQKGFRGDRNNILQQADDLFAEITGSKKALVQGITETTPNKFDGAYKYLRETYAVPGQEAAFREIEELAAKKTLTAVEMDRIRSLIDVSMPGRAYSGAEPVKIAGIQNLVDPIRKRLGQLDKTGSLRKINGEIQTLYQLLPAMRSSTSSNVIRQLLFRNLGRVGSIFGLSAATGGASLPITAALAGVDLITDFPIVSSTLSQAFSKGGKVLPKSVPGVSTGITGAGSQAIQEL